MPATVINEPRTSVNMCSAHIASVTLLEIWRFRSIYKPIQAGRISYASVLVSVVVGIYVNL